MKSKRIVLAGGTGFLGQILQEHFRNSGCEVVVLTRSPRATSGDNRCADRFWDGRTLGEWEGALNGADVVINLAGRSVNCRYHARNRRLILDSRVDSTRVLGEAIARCASPPKVWLNSSTATIYKHSLDWPMDESAEIGATPEAKDAFSVEVATAWERAFDAASAPRTRKVALRSAMVLGLGENSVFPVLCRLVRCGLGGRMASGNQFVSWIHETDFCRAIDWLIDHEEFTGPVNLAAPNPLPNREMMTTLRELCGVRFGLPAAEWMLELGALLLRTETELIIKSRRVLPGRLLASGFQFHFSLMRDALSDLLAPRDDGGLFLCSSAANKAEKAKQRQFRIGFLAALLLFELSGTGGERSKSAGMTSPVAPAPVPALGESFPAGVSAEDRRQLERDLASLSNKLAALRASATATRETAKLDTLADADLFQKGLVWALRYEINLATNDITLLKTSAQRGSQRADALLASQTPWTRRKGRVLRGYISAVDGSTQPYGVIIPARYDGTNPMRLDVVLHGSTRPVGLSELRFGSRFDEGDDAAKSAPSEEFIELHPLGRVENCYRWAGETDVFEAIESACRNYRIDRDRIVLRGMSMGASGTWHLGLKHPSRFVALGPYCGYVDTHRFSETPLSNFIKVGPLPPHQERALHMLDSVDYAANAGIVPAIAAIGDKDVFFQAHVIMGEAMAKEGLQMVNLISPGTGHVIDPVTHREQMARIGEYAAKGLDRAPRKLRFVTWTLKYNRCHWLELLALKEHYERTEIAVSVSEDGSADIVEPRNITKFAINLPMLQGAPAKLRIGGAEVTLPQRKSSAAPRALVFAQTHGKWKCLGPREETALSGKRPGVQGPIDDAFTAPFLCVRGTHQPWNPAVGSWADASLRRFAYEWARYMRGDLPVKNDTEVTEADVRTKNLILFGDPGSNVWIRKALPKLPVFWNRDEVRLGAERQSAKDHAPVLICASPLPNAGDRYLVLNSGHTFHEKEFASLNYLLFPRLGDWAVMRIAPGAEAWKPSSDPFPEIVVRAGFFDEQWKNPGEPTQ